MLICNDSIPNQHAEWTILGAGFTFNFARKEGVWGSGTYYSSQPALAISYEHPVQGNDPACKHYLAGVDPTGVKGVQAATRAVTCKLSLHVFEFYGAGQQGIVGAHYHSSPAYGQDLRVNA